MDWKASSPNAATVSTKARRNRDWLKIKVVSTAGLRHRRLHAWRARLLQLAGSGPVTSTASWCTPAKSGTGFNDKSLKDIYSQHRAADHEEKPLPGAVKALRDVTWVKPELVAEIKYLEITPDGLLRAPVFLRIAPG